MVRIQVRDIKTDEVFTVSPVEDRATFVTRDGVKVKLYPVTLRTLVKKGQRFEGYTVTGTRQLLRVT